MNQPASEGGFFNDGSTKGTQNVPPSQTTLSPEVFNNNPYTSLSTQNDGYNSGELSLTGNPYQALTAENQELIPETVEPFDKSQNMDYNGLEANKVTEDLVKLLKQSTCSSDDLNRYLSKINSDYADTYAKTGKWPTDIQIPKSPDVLNADGSINWDMVPKGGYVLDTNGDAIKEQYIPDIGEIIDRHGPNNGRFTSPVRNNRPYSYAQRSLPYLEDPLNIINTK